MLRRTLLAVALLLLAAAGTAAVVAVHTLHRLDAVVVDRFNGRRWNFPSRIYGDAFLIYPGIDLRAAGVYERLQRLNYRETEDGELRKGDYRRSPGGLDLFLRDFSYPGERVDDRLVHLDLNGDVVLEINRQSVDSDAAYKKALKKVEKGKSVLLLVRRGDNTIFMALKAPKD